MTLFRSQGVSDLGRDRVESEPCSPVVSEILVKTSRKAVRTEIVRVGVVWVRWKVFSVEMRPLVHPSSPFRICVANNFFQVIVRGEICWQYSAKAMSG